MPFLDLTSHMTLIPFWTYLFIWLRCLFGGSSFLCDLDACFGPISNMNLKSFLAYLLTLFWCLFRTPSHKWLWCHFFTYPLIWLWCLFGPQIQSNTKDFKNDTFSSHVIKVKLGRMLCPETGPTELLILCSLYSGSLWQRRYMSTSWLSFDLTNKN